MRERREQPEPVVDDHRIAGKVERLGEPDPGLIRGPNPGAAWIQEIGAAVGVARLAVEDAARAETTVGAMRDRTDEGGRPETFACRRLPDRAQSRGLLFDPRLFPEWRVHERVVHLQ